MGWLARVQCSLSVGTGVVTKLTRAHPSPEKKNSNLNQLWQVDGRKKPASKLQSLAHQKAKPNYERTVALDLGARVL